MNGSPPVHTRLPAGSKDSPTPRALPATLGARHDSLGETAIGTPETATPREDTASSAAPARVLVIDDDPRIGRFLARALRGHSRAVRAISSASALAAALGDLEPDAVFLDLRMAHGDGVEALRELAARECAATVVLMSGVDRRVIDTALSLGRSLGLRMGPPLHKPFTPNAARQRIARPAAPARGDSRAVIATSSAEISAAIAANHIEPFFQPMVEARGSGRVLRVEALARWRHPARGLLEPAMFLDAVEACGLMPGFTLHMLDRAAAAARRLARAGHRLEIAVNLSPVVLEDIDFPDAVDGILAAHDWPPDRVVLELTEHRDLGALQRAMDVLARIRIKGIGLSLDDFGSGYSTVGQIYRLPLCELKIDKSCVVGGASDERAAAIVRSTLQLARDDGLRTVAEGVESAAIAEWLAALGCDLLQGFHISHPLAENDLRRWLAARSG